MMSVELAAVLKVLELLANFQVDVSKRLPVASCVSIMVALPPVATLVRLFKVMLPVSVSFCMDPLFRSGVIVPVALPYE
jgi:hypothetical protein